MASYFRGWVHITLVLLDSLKPLTRSIVNRVGIYSVTAVMKTVSYVSFYSHRQLNSEQIS